MALVLMVTIIRQFGSGMQNTFYAVYLDGIGLSGTLIGFLVSATGVTGIAALATGWLGARVNEFSLLLVATALSIVAIAIVPLFTDFAPLFVASGLRGAALAVSVALIVSLIARTVGPETQGRAMGLRTTCNLAANVTIPVIMGGLAELLGLEAAFYIVGGAGLVLIVFAAVAGRGVRTPSLD
jgi:predicted MFS family arabinose efflux permease